MPGARLDVRVEAKSFGATPSRTAHILRDVAFQAMPGEVVALFGPSGTGKTTLLRIICGLDRAFAGRVVPPAGRVGVVFQEPRLAPWLTVAENLRLVAPGSSLGELAAALDAVDLPNCLPLRPREISLGMARRVALARALIVEPSWLVLDEPFASLDPGLAARLARLVADYAESKGAAVILATHALEDGLVIADRALVLQGRPATLAGDVKLSPRARDADRARLIQDFPFLRGAGFEAPERDEQAWSSGKVGEADAL